MAQSDVAGKKLAAGICGILIGSLGIHKFVLGYTKEGLILLLATVLTCGFGGMVTWIIGLVEGIIYLTKSDDEFEATYIKGSKPWF
ncbi:MAG: TM2 domain-containing protein [Planctomycetota bacterium]